MEKCKYKISKNTDNISIQYMSGKGCRSLLGSIKCSEFDIRTKGITIIVKKCLMNRLIDETDLPPPSPPPPRIGGRKKSRKKSKKTGDRKKSKSKSKSKKSKSKSKSKSKK